MAARSYWKGFWQVGQVTCHVAFQTATDDVEQVHLHLMNADNGHALRQQYVDAETGEVVPHDRQGRGYEVSSGVLVPIEEAEVDALRVASSDVLEVTGFDGERVTPSELFVPSAADGRAVRRPEVAIREDRAKRLADAGYIDDDGEWGYQ